MDPRIRIRIHTEMSWIRRDILPGVEGEDIFRILPGVGDAGVPVVEGEADHQVAARLKHGVAAHKPTHLHVRYTYR